jgi:hypothetical protein
MPEYVARLELWGTVGRVELRVHRDVGVACAGASNLQQHLAWTRGRLLDIEERWKGLPRLEHDRTHRLDRLPGV